MNLLTKYGKGAQIKVVAHNRTEQQTVPELFYIKYLKIININIFLPNFMIYICSYYSLAILTINNLWLSSNCERR